MTKNKPDSDNLKKSFERVKSQTRMIERECKLIEEANLFDLPLESYQKLFEHYINGKIDEDILDDYPKLELAKWPEIPKQWWQWVKPRKWSLFRQGLWFLIEKGAILSILWAAINYIRAIPERQKQAEAAKTQSHQLAWLVVNSARNRKEDGGRVEALEYLNKEELSLEGIDLTGANLRFINLGAKIQDKKYSGGQLKDAEFDKANLTGAIFNDTFLYGASFKGANMHRVNFCNAELQGANLQDANLQGANLQGANLQGANLQGANLNSLEFSDNYIVSKLKKANFKGTCIKLSDYKGKGKKLIKSNLEGANLEGANLEGANLKGANLEGANLKGADIKETDFRGTNNLTPEQVKSAKNWQLSYYDINLFQQLGLSPRIPK